MLLPAGNCVRPQPRAHRGRRSELRSGQKIGREGRRTDHTEANAGATKTHRPTHQATRPRTTSPNANRRRRNWQRSVRSRFHTSRGRQKSGGRSQTPGCRSRLSSGRSAQFRQATRAKESTSQVQGRFGRRCRRGVEQAKRLSDSNEGDKTKLAKRKITLDTGEVSFWEAFDQLCLKAGCGTGADAKEAMGGLHVWTAPNGGADQLRRGVTRRSSRIRCSATTASSSSW